MPVRWYGVTSQNQTVLISGQHGAQVVTDGQNAKVLAVEPGWKPTRALGLGDRLSVLFLGQEDQAGSRVEDHPTEAQRHDDQSGKSAGWLLANSHELKGVVERIDDTSDDGGYREAITKALFEEAVPLLTARSEVMSHGEPMRPAEREVLGRFLIGLDSRLACAFRPLSDLAEESAITTEAFHACARTFVDYVQGLIEPTVVPAILRRTLAVTHMRHIPLELSLRETVHLCWTSDSSCPFVIVLNYRKKKRVKAFVYSPERQAVFGDDFSEEAVAFLNRALADLFLTIISSNAPPPGHSYRHTDRGGVLLAGRSNFGHAIWEELQAVDRVLQSESRWTNAPFLYIQRGGGATMYGPVEDLYPELKDRFVYTETLQDIMNHAFSHGVQLFRNRSQFALRATRDRMARLVCRHGDVHELAASARAVLKRRPAIVFGLRLSNRYPVDPMGFYVHLTEALVKRFGQLSVIFDGMNADPSTGRAAARVFNGNVASDGQTELNQELEFVGRYRAEVSSLPVQVQNCVGTPIRDNLFWLSQADFFVAPNGGGLAKLRWALDLPGYVLTSRVNFKYCTLVNAYGDNTKTEEPFSPIYMNRPDEVEDVPVEPPRLKRLKSRRIPYPENFIVSDTVIPQICDLVQTSLEHKAIPV